MLIIYSYLKMQLSNIIYIMILPLKKSLINAYIYPVLK